MNDDAVGDLVSHFDTVRPISVGVADKQHAALAFAAEEAQLSSCPVRVVHAYTVPPTPNEALSDFYGIDVEGTFRESGREVLADATTFLDAHNPGLVVDTVLEEGSATRALTATSKTSKMVVVGPDDDVPWYSRLFLSRVSRKLTENAGCPVVVVPDTWDSASPRKGVTLLIDDQTIARGPLRFAFDQAARHGDALLVLHVHESDDSHREAVSWHDMTRLIGRWSAMYPHVWVDTRVVNGTPDLETVRLHERTGLLVLGRSHKHQAAASLHRSLARTVIEHSECPVAVVPAGYDA